MFDLLPPVYPIYLQCLVHLYQPHSSSLFRTPFQNRGTFDRGCRRQRGTVCPLGARALDKVPTVTWQQRFLAPLRNLFPSMALKSPGPKSGDIPSRIKTPQLSQPQPTFPHLNCRICIEPLPPNLEKLQENLEEAEMVSVLPCGCHHITLFRWFQFGVSQP